MSDKHVQTYLVGGAVRDQLLGRPAVDRDHVVVGALPEDLLKRGYRPVGKDFPVFLHPQSGEEYALARTERKHGHGYHGFVFHTGKEVRLEDDLRRRDLTINAMAIGAAGELIDPFGGRADLEQRLLRHVSPAFAEDPLRILRVARFAARFAPLGFTVAPQTLALMRAMVENGEVEHLVAERVWAETRKALQETQPAAFLQVLRQCGALRVLLPEVDALYGVPQRAEYHPEIDTGIHTEMVVDMAARLAPGNDLVVFGALLHDLGKALTPEDILPRHIGHEQRGVAPAMAVCTRLKVPTEHRQLAPLVCREHLNGHRALELKPQTVLKLFESLDAFRRPGRLAAFITICEADARGRLGYENSPYPQADFLRRAFRAAQAVEARAAVAAGLRGPAVGAAVRRERIRAIGAVPKPARAPGP